MRPQSRIPTGLRVGDAQAWLRTNVSPQSPTQIGGQDLQTRQFVCIGDAERAAWGQHDATLMAIGRACDVCLRSSAFAHDRAVAAVDKIEEIHKKRGLTRQTVLCTLATS